jgi:hypothetical protein
VSIYAHLTNGHGDYELSLQLRDADESVRWEWLCPEPIPLPDPLRYHRFTLYDVILEFAEPGRHSLVMFANGQESARHALNILSGADAD